MRVQCTGTPKWDAAGEVVIIFWLQPRKSFMYATLCTICIYCGLKRNMETCRDFMTGLSEVESERTALDRESLDSVNDMHQ